MATSPKKTVAPEPDPEIEVPHIDPEPDPEPEQKPPAKHVLLNPGTSTVIYTEDGRGLSGGETVGVEKIDPVGQAALDRGYLVEK